MRILVDANEAQVAALDELAKREQRPRAAVIRAAIDGTEVTPELTPQGLRCDVPSGPFLWETEVEIAELVPRLRAIAGTGFDARIYIRADDGAAYGDVARVMANINAAGFSNLGLVTDQDQGQVADSDPGQGGYTYQWSVAWGPQNKLLRTPQYTRRHACGCR